MFAGSCWYVHGYPLSLIICFASSFLFVRIVEATLGGWYCDIHIVNGFSKDVECTGFGSLLVTENPILTDYVCRTLLATMRGQYYYHSVDDDRQWIVLLRKP